MLKASASFKLSSPKIESFAKRAESIDLSNSSCNSVSFQSVVIFFSMIRTLVFSDSKTIEGDSPKRVPQARASTSSNSNYAIQNFAD